MFLVSSILNIKEMRLSCFVIAGGCTSSRRHALLQANGNRDKVSGRQVHNESSGIHGIVAGGGYFYGY